MFRISAGKDCWRNLKHLQCQTYVGLFLAKYGTAKINIDKSYTHIKVQQKMSAPSVARNFSPVDF
jgi:hypothetical protein